MPPQIGIIMNIASIDPGVSTGLVIASTKVGVEYVVIKTKFVATVDDSFVPVDVVGSNRCRIVLMEQMPSGGSDLGKDVFASLWNYFVTFQFIPTTSISLMKNQNRLWLHLILPAQWKPFMRNRLGMLPDCNSKHEKEALAMLYYFIQVNNQGRRVVYE